MHRDSSEKISWEIIKKALFPLILFVLFLVVYIFYKIKLVCYISQEAQAGLKKYVITILVLIVGFVFQRITGAVSAWYKDNIASQTLTRLDDELIPLVRRTAKVLIWIIALLIILPFYGINISALITTLGVS
ncbi:MAG: hypothetical protein JW867_01625, partial [Candidatus Omnitrophica bacterium]|nr:hypothetical protein [Candidatus Omnitrophota bacterium]